MDDTQPTITADKKTPLGFLEPKETLRAIKARGAKKAIGRLKIILPIVSLLALLGLVIWPSINPDKLISKAIQNAPDLVIENLNFKDTDTKNQAYSISAAKATRPSGVANTFDLQKPQGEITLQDGAWVAAKSDYGRFDKDKNHLWLGGNVEIFHDKGLQFTTDELQADLNQRNAWGEKSVLIQGDFGEIRGVGFRLLDSGNVIVVNGPAKARLNLPGGSSSDKPRQVK